MPLDPADVPSHIATTFSAPLDLLKSGVAVPHLYDWQAKENPNYPIFTYHDGDKLEYITYASANKAIDRAARYIASGLSSQDEGMAPPVIAILANTVAKDALSKLPAGKITVRNMPTFEDLFPSDDSKAREAFEVEAALPKAYDMDSCAIILHSSGSTDQPKPYRWTHKRVTAWGYESTLFEWDTSRSVFGCHGIPMFHAMGTYLCAAAPMKGYVIAAFKPASPPVLPTPDAVWQNTVATKCDFFFTVPSNVEEWSRYPDKVAVMQRVRGVVFGGAPLNPEVGDALALQGVNLLPAYGMTEVGTINQTMGPQRGLDWPYWKPVRTKEFRFIPRGENQYELVVLSDPDMPLPVINIKIDGLDGYATNDLVEPHPTRPNYWKLLGRADDQIILSNGEKVETVTNPLPLEKIVNSDPHVKSSVMFGSGKFQNGILIKPKEEFAIDPNDVEQVQGFRDKVWPSVERANKYAPQHSRIFKEMILITSPDKPFELNAKGLPRRKVIIANYEDEIEALYKQVKDSTHRDFHPPTSWDEQNTLEFIRAVVHDTLRRPVADDADIYQSGCDSLQATWIRNTILRALRETEPTAVKRLPTDFVFQAPTISALARTVHASVHHASTATTSRTPDDLWQYVDQYSADLPERPTALIERPASGKDVVLITGTTGGFGCDALEHLLRDESVERVYAFNRKGSEALERQHAQFRARGLDETLLNGPKFRLVEVILHEPGFGLEATLLDEIRQSPFYTAWKVDFKLSVQSFEGDLQGARNLVDLAISSSYRQAPTIVFISSIGVFANYKGAVPAPETLLYDPASPFGTGYNESKWITEHVLHRATKLRGVSTVVIRLAQVCGDRVGHWNEKEWFPALVKSAQFQGCLPEVDGNVTWVPSYEGAKAVTEMRHSPEPFLHLVHPRPVPWSTIMTPIAEELGVPLASYEEWLSVLEQASDGNSDDGAYPSVELVQRNPAFRLVHFFKGLKTSPSREPLGTVYLSTEKSTRVSKTLANLPPLGAQQAKMWLAEWRRSGFLE
ncbi:hypothetical protein ACG7TL_002021 [Trametes sanguinea]